MSSAASIAVTPNRDFDTENFPTASLLLARTARAQVMAARRANISRIAAMAGGAGSSAQGQR